MLLGMCWEGVGIGVILLDFQALAGRNWRLTRESYSNITVITHKTVCKVTAILQ